MGGRHAGSQVREIDNSSSEGAAGRRDTGTGTSSGARTGRDTRSIRSRLCNRNPVTAASTSSVHTTPIRHPHAPDASTDTPAEDDAVRPSTGAPESGVEPVATGEPALVSACASAVVWEVVQPPMMSTSARPRMVSSRPDHHPAAMTRSGRDRGSRGIVPHCTNPTFASPGSRPAAGPPRLRRQSSHIASTGTSFSIIAERRPSPERKDQCPRGAVVSVKAGSRIAVMPSGSSLPVRTSSAAPLRTARVAELRRDRLSCVRFAPPGTCTRRHRRRHRLKNTRRGYKVRGSGVRGRGGRG